MLKISTFHFLSFLLVGQGLAMRVVDENIKKDKENAVLAIVAPVERAIVKLTFENCTSIKTALGVSYDRLAESMPDVSHLTLDLWSGKTMEELPIVGAASQILASPNYKKDLPMAIFIHGFMNNAYSQSVHTTCTALMKKGGLNILALDSSSLIMHLYLRSSTLVPFIGQKLGQVLTEFNQSGLAASSIHMIGHSLGSHIAGFAGKTFRNLTGYNVGRITGLDPAGPCFFLEQEAVKLNRADADFVDVIHTSGGVYGLTTPIGDADFYPNKGREQPGCYEPSCSHSRSWELFAESVLHPESFPAVRCDCWARVVPGACAASEADLMGYGADPSLEGRFCLETAGPPRFGLGRDGIAAARKPFGHLFKKKLISH